MRKIKKGCANKFSVRLHKQNGISNLLILYSNAHKIIVHALHTYIWCRYMVKNLLAYLKKNK